MIEWYWLFVAAFCSFLGGVATMALMAASGRSDILENNMMLREKLANLKQMNHELRLFVERNSPQAADGTEMQE